MASNQHIDKVRQSNAEAARSAQECFSDNELSANRRDLLRLGSRLVYAIPIVQVFCASEAAAASTMSGASCVPVMGVCDTDADCCSGDCRVGTCQ